MDCVREVISLGASAVSGHSMVNATDIDTWRLTTIQDMSIGRAHLVQQIVIRTVVRTCNALVGGRPHKRALVRAVVLITEFAHPLLNRRMMWIGHLLVVTAVPTQAALLNSVTLTAQIHRREYAGNIVRGQTFGRFRRAQLR